MPLNLLSVCVTVELVSSVKQVNINHPRKTRDTQTTSPMLLFYSLWQVHSRQCKYKQNMLFYLASPPLLYNLSNNVKSKFLFLLFTM
jgi:hypothetical protein